jgi:hypothetical protein
MGDVAMSELPKRSCEICTDITTGEAQTVITVESSPPIMALAWVNFLKQRLHVLQVDYTHVTADRIVVESRPEAAESVAQLLQSAAECADDYVQGARSNGSDRETQRQPAQFGEP